MKPSYLYILFTLFVSIVPIAVAFDEGPKLFSAYPELFAFDENVCLKIDGNLSCSRQSFAEQIASLKNPRVIDGENKLYLYAIDDDGFHHWVHKGNGVIVDLETPDAGSPISFGLTGTGDGSGGGCVLGTNGVKCWSSVDGDGLTVVPELSRPSHLSVGTYTACVIDENQAKCWGGEVAIKVQRYTLKTLKISPTMAEIFVSLTIVEYNAGDRISKPP